MSRRQQAIDIIERHQDIHRQWLEWQQRDPSWRDKVTPDSPGGPQHHQECIKAYDMVLAELRGEPE